MAEGVRDFQYYAEKAERTLMGLRGVASPEAVDAWAHVADVYVKLAVAAPEPAARKIEMHAADCPCLTTKEK